MLRKASLALMGLAACGSPTPVVAPASPAAPAPAVALSSYPERGAMGAEAPPASSASSASTAPPPPPPRETGCTIEGPRNLVPARVASVRVGMSLDEVRRVLGKPSYSPTEGQYYFFTGAKCPLEGAGRSAPCGVVAEFETDAQRKSTLQSCWWGAIGE